MSKLSTLTSNCLLDNASSSVFINHILHSHLAFDQKEGSEPAPPYILLEKRLNLYASPCLVDVSWRHLTEGRDWQQIFSWILRTHWSTRLQRALSGNTGVDVISSQADSYSGVWPILTPWENEKLNCRMFKQVFKYTYKSGHTICRIIWSSITWFLHLSQLSLFVCLNALESAWQGRPFVLAETLHWGIRAAERSLSSLCILPGEKLTTGIPLAEILFGWNFQFSLKWKGLWEESDLILCGVCVCAYACFSMKIKCNAVLYASRENADNGFFSLECGIDG